MGRARRWSGLWGTGCGLSAVLGALSFSPHEMGVTSEISRGKGIREGNQFLSGMCETAGVPIVAIRRVFAGE